MAPPLGTTPAYCTPIIEELVKLESFTLAFLPSIYIAPPLNLANELTKLEPSIAVFSPST